MHLTDRCLAIVRAWYADRDALKGTHSDTFIACAGLKFAEITRTKWPVQQEDYVGKGGRFRSTGPQIQAILRRFGEDREYTSEGARTTGGTIEACADLIHRFENTPEYTGATAAERDEIATAVQRWIYDSIVKRFLDAEGLTIEIDLETTLPSIIGSILAAASRRKVSGAVAQHLVGAKLALRYPSRKITNHSHTTKDKHLGRRGDFAVEDTVFHVTMTPGDGVVDKCSKDVGAGYRAVLLVPIDEITAAHYFAKKAKHANGIWVVSIEDFVGQNIAELGEFQKQGMRDHLRALLQTYNQRAAECGEIPAVMLKIPERL